MPPPALTIAPTPLQRLPDVGPVALWQVDLALPADAANLDDDERRRAARFVADDVRRRFVAAHVALRALLAAATGQAPDALRFVAGEHGKPRLAGGDAPGRCSFSLSHSEDVALVGLADTASTEIGVDVEVPRPLPARELEDLARRCLSTAERAALAARPAQAHALAFLQAWTRKEACLKALGAGLNVEPATVETGIGTDRVELVLAFGGSSCRLAVESLEPGRNRVGAVAWVRRQD